MLNLNEEVEFLAFGEFLKQCSEFVNNYEKMKKMYPTISALDITFFVHAPKIGKVCEVLSMSQHAMDMLQADIQRGAQSC